MQTQPTLFDVRNMENDTFELSCHKNGNTYWLASELAKMLEYSDLKAFMNPINKAISVCTSIGHNILDHFKPLEDGDYKLDRFACFLVSMNADIRKPKVAQAQGYFATIAEVVDDYIKAQQIERIETREKVKDITKTLGSTAKAHGVTNYAFFNNAGYMGMYNMSLNNLKEIKGVDKKATIFDFMGSRELAANLFRLNETEAKIQSSHIYGQKNLENTARQVGKKVRDIMIENDGVRPEMLARNEDIKKVKSELKKVDRKFKKIDKTKQNANLKTKRPLNIPCQVNSDRKQSYHTFS